jgi:ribosomal protein L5
MGIKEHTIFPEINVDTAKVIHGMDITFVTNADSDEEAATNTVCEALRIMPIKVEM